MKVELPVGMTSATTASITGGRVSSSVVLVTVGLHLSVSTISVLVVCDSVNTVSLVLTSVLMIVVVTRIVTSVSTPYWSVK